MNWSPLTESPSTTLYIEYSHTSPHIYWMSTEIFTFFPLFYFITIFIQLYTQSSYITMYRIFFNQLVFLLCSMALHCYMWLTIFICWYRIIFSNQFVKISWLILLCQNQSCLLHDKARKHLRTILCLPRQKCILPCHDVNKSYHSSDCIRLFLQKIRLEKRKGGCVSLCCVYSFFSWKGGQQTDFIQNLPVPLLTLSS